MQLLVSICLIQSQAKFPLDLESIAPTFDESNLEANKPHVVKVAASKLKTEREALTAVVAVSYTLQTIPTSLFQQASATEDNLRSFHSVRIETCVQQRSASVPNCRHPGIPRCFGLRERQLSGRRPDEICSFRKSGMGRYWKDVSQSALSRSVGKNSSNFRSSRVSSLTELNCAIVPKSESR